MLTFQIDVSSELPSIDPESTMTVVNGQEILEPESVMTIIEGFAKTWRNNAGQLHRIGGPAIIWENGTKEFWINGIDQDSGYNDHM